MDTAPPLQPGSLLRCLEQAHRRGLASGALQSIDTHSQVLEEAGIGFLVRVLGQLADKDRAQQGEQRLRAAGRTDVDPFLDPDPDLVVGALSTSHLALLNKYNVVDHHLLVVTRAFAPQTELLDRADFTALSQCLAEIDGLGFYNGGVEAGSSQPHKHLQLLPLPLAAHCPGLPIDPLLDRAPLDAAIGHSPELPFRHALARYTPSPVDSVADAARAMLHGYRALLEATLGPLPPGPDQPAPYNLLVTRQRLLLVPRCQHEVEGIALNALGYAGTLLLRHAAQLDTLRRLGPLQLLARAACPG